MFCNFDAGITSDEFVQHAGSNVREQLIDFVYAQIALKRNEKLRTVSGDIAAMLARSRAILPF